MIETFSYDADGTPLGYVCSVCGFRGGKLWRESSVFGPRMFCLECIDPTGEKRSDLVDSDAIGWFVPAVPTEDGAGTFWGYGAVPWAGVEWWHRLPCSVAVMPGRKARP